MEEIITFTTAQSGPWSEPITWVGCLVPPDDSGIVIAPGHQITLEGEVTTCGITISAGASLILDSTKNCTIHNCENMEVYGTLYSHPNANVVHLINWHEVDETMFMGGGMMVMATDPGIWVRENGKLDLVGDPKTPYLALAGAAMKGDKTITLSGLPYGWKVGDEISIAPTLGITNSAYYTGFEVRVISAIHLNRVTFDLPLVYDHPQVPNPFNANVYTAEVMNLTRNIRIEGKGDGTANPLTNGRIHINFGMLTGPVNMSHVQLRYMGPRKANADGYTDFVLGRYACHIHMCGNATNGSLLEGLVIRDSGGPGIVAHASHGITSKNCIDYSGFDNRFWWDPPPSNDSSNPVNNSNNNIWIGCIAALIKCDPSFRGYRNAGFMLGSGIGNQVKNCIVIGNQGNAGAAGYVWPESSNYTDNVWLFLDNIAHNNKTDGVFVWENDPHAHIVTGLVAYNNGAHGIEHGAYTNAYRYIECYLFNNKNGILLYANPTPSKTTPPDEFGYIQSWKRIFSTEPLAITQHTLVGKGPVLFKDCKFPKVIVNEFPTRNIPGLYDFINCNNLQPINFSIQSMEKGSLIRVQEGRLAYQINDKGIVTAIAPFFNYTT